MMTIHAVTLVLAVLALATGSALITDTISVLRTLHMAKINGETEFHVIQRLTNSGLRLVNALVVGVGILAHWPDMVLVMVVVAVLLFANVHDITSRRLARQMAMVRRKAEDQTPHQFGDRR